MKRTALLGVIILSLLLASCGGGGGHSSAPLPTAVPAASDASDAPDASTPELPARIQHTLKDGKISRLQLPADTRTLAKHLYAYAQALAAQKQARIKAIMPNGMPTYIPGRQTQLTPVAKSEIAQPLIVGDNGRTLAALSVADNGRSAAFGTDVLSHIDGAYHAIQPVFKRMLAWLLYGKAAHALPATMTIGVDGIDAGGLIAGLKALGIEASSQACDLSIQADCKVDLVIAGINGKPGASRTTNTHALLAAGTPLLYLHNDHWGSSTAADQVVTALGITPLPYAGNYYSDDGIEIHRDRQSNLAATRQYATILPLLKRLADDIFEHYDWSGCSDHNCDGVADFNHDILQPAGQIGAAINGYNQRGENIFKQPHNRLYRLAAVWADAYRQQIAYPVRHNEQPVAFQKAVIADAWVAYVRAYGAAQPDLGDFISRRAAQLPVDPSPQTVTMTLEQGSGFTAVGRFAQPGVKLVAKLVNAAGATVSLRLNTQRSGSTRWGGNNGYTRPRLLRSPNMHLIPHTPLAVVSPYGGNIELAYSGATPGQTVTLQLQGVAQQPFLDMTQGGDPATYVQTLLRTSFDWTEIKVAGAEIHGLTSKMQDLISGNTYKGDGQKYIDELLKLLFKDAYRLAGFASSDYTLTPGVLSFCSANGWDCTNETLHRIPGVQHFNSDNKAQCGFMCSGNPIDAAAAIGPRGWGTSHELGHNLQVGDLNIYGGRSAEVSNNLFPLHKDWTMYHRMGIDLNADRVAYKAVFDALKQCQAGPHASQCMYEAVWGNADYAAQNGERMAFYMQWVLYWKDQTGQLDQAWDIVTLLYLHHRLLRDNDIDWATQRDRLGYSNYASLKAVDADNKAPSGATKGFNNNMLIALSRITQHDQTATFDLWGVQYSQQAAAQVASYPKEPAFLYVDTSSNNLKDAQKLTDMAKLVWPY